MRHLTLRFDSASKLQQYLLSDQPLGGVFSATQDSFELGEPVLVTICLPDVPEGVVLAATVIWRRQATKWRSSLVPGVGLGFTAGSEPQLRFLMELLAGTVVATRRRWPRHQLELPVEVTAGGEAYPATTRDIGAGGMFVVFDTTCPTDCPVGSKVSVDVFPEGPDERVSFHGKVAWASSGGEEPGFGLAFPPGDKGLRRRAERIITACRPVSMAESLNLARTTATLWRKPRNRRDT